MNLTDLARWTVNAVTEPSWEARVRLIASLIPQGSAVLDVGAGARTLARYLPAGATYQAVDVVEGPETIRADFNALEVPELSRAYDYVVCAGVLEYVGPVHLLLATLAGWGDTVVLSYAVHDGRSTCEGRRRNGWINDLTEADLLALLAQHGLRVVRRLQWEAQVIFELDARAARRRLFAAGAQGGTSQVGGVYRADPGNTGDAYCSPFSYFDFGSLRLTDIFAVPPVTWLPSTLVVGGGGLFGNTTFDPRFEALFARPYDAVVGWGIGENSRIDTARGYVPPADLSYPDYTSRFDLLGVRDHGAPFSWVPCASCLHPLFAERWPIVHDVVVYEHKRVPIDIEGFPKMSNGTGDLARVAAFLGSARVVITNSYHGAYWAQLMGKGVVAFPFSSKFYGLRHRVTLCEPKDWRQGLDRVELQAPALAECVDANLAFSARVRDLIGWPRSRPSRRRGEHPTGAGETT